MVSTRRTALVSVVTGAVLLTACTSDAPQPAPQPTAASPSPTETAVPITGPRVVVLLPAAGVPAGEVASYAQAVDRLRSAYADRLGEVRRVTLDDPAFAADTVTFLAEEGHDLVCVVGAPLVRTVPAVARSYPNTRFCAAPAVYEEAPDNVLALELAVAEPAFVLGVVAATLFPGAPPGFVGARSEHAVEQRRRGFQEGVASRRGQARALGGTFAEDPISAAAITTRQVEAGARVLYTAAGELDVAAREAAAGGSAAVAGSAATLLPVDGDPPVSVLLAVRTHIEPALAVAVDRLLDGWDPTAATLGLAEGAFSFVPGGHPEAEVAVELAEQVAAERFPLVPTGDPAP